MTHDNHEALPGYDARQIWHDGCSECEFRSKYLPGTMTALDNETFRLAWQRAADANRDQNGTTGKISQAELPLLDLLWTLQVVFERCAGIEIGRLPR
jgi:hypothetical protein